MGGGRSIVDRRMDGIYAVGLVLKVYSAGYSFAGLRIVEIAHIPHHSCGLNAQGCLPGDFQYGVEVHWLFELVDPEDILDCSVYLNDQSYELLSPLGCHQAGVLGRGLDGCIVLPCSFVVAKHDYQPGDVWPLAC